MPAVDQCEAQMIRAFEKAGWSVVERQILLRIDVSRSGQVYIDLLLRNEQDDGSHILVEVKCFNQKLGFMEQFYLAIGQYGAYEALAAYNQVNYPLYLAVPHTVFDAQFTRLGIPAIFGSEENQNCGGKSRN